VEAPLLVRPYLKAMSRSELFTLMTTGMATIAGTVMVIYASILRPVLPDAMGQILIASLISTMPSSSPAPGSRHSTQVPIRKWPVHTRHAAVMVKPRQKRTFALTPGRHEAYNATRCI